MKALRKIKGTQDILPGQSEQWAALENLIRQTMTAYNFKELRTPIFEATELFARGIGQLTDIVSKEMYTFKDRGDKSLTLKPEMTAPIMRAYLENKLYARAQVNKFFYIAPLFRQENPQAGRLRQFHQFGAETLGTPSPDADVEIIDLVLTIYARVGLKNLQLRINSVGDSQCRVPYKTILQDYIRPRLDQYCQDCQRRFSDNPLRILDCKNETCRALNAQAPKLNQHLCQECQEHYQQVKRGLESLGISYQEDPYLVRGLDYYTRTVFEITSDALGAQNAISGGGRYDLLAEELGGPATPAVGFASGIERLFLVMEKQQISLAPPHRLDIYLVTLGETANQQALKWLSAFRKQGFSVEKDYLKRSIKAQMREAGKLNSRFVLILGEDELAKQLFAVKNMDQGTQEEVPFTEIYDYLQQQMRNHETMA